MGSLPEWNICHAIEREGGKREGGGEEGKRERESERDTAVRNALL